MRLGGNGHAPSLKRMCVSETVLKSRSTNNAPQLGAVVERATRGGATNGYPAMGVFLAMRLEKCRDRRHLAHRNEGLCLARQRTQFAISTVGRMNRPQKRRERVTCACRDPRGPRVLEASSAPGFCNHVAIFGD